MPADREGGSGGGLPRPALPQAKAGSLLPDSTRTGRHHILTRKRFALRWAAGIILAALAAGGTLIALIRSVTILADGRELHLTIRGLRAGTVREALSAAGVPPGERDLVQPGPDTPLARGMRIHLIRVREEEVMEREDLPEQARSRRVLRGNLRPVEVRRVVRIRLERVERRTVYDGRVVVRTLLRERRVQRQVTRLALLRDDGSVEREYDLASTRRIRMLATGYYPGDPLSGPNNETYLGLPLRRGMVAVDPKVIRLGSRLYIPGYGYGFAADTGNKIVHHRVDLGCADAREADRWNWKRVSVYVLESPRRWNPRRERMPLTP